MSRLSPQHDPVHMAKRKWPRQPGVPQPQRPPAHPAAAPARPSAPNRDHAIQLGMRGLRHHQGPTHHKTPDTTHQHHNSPLTPVARQQRAHTTRTMEFRRLPPRGGSCYTGRLREPTLVQAPGRRNVSAAGAQHRRPPRPCREPDPRGSDIGPRPSSPNPDTGRTSAHPHHNSPAQRTTHATYGPLKPVRTPVAILGSLGVCIYLPASRHWSISYSLIHLT